MARYRVRGARRDNGADFELVLDAPSASIAERDAQALGMLVAGVEHARSAETTATPDSESVSFSPRGFLKAIAFFACLGALLVAMNHEVRYSVWHNAVATFLLVIVFQLDTVVSRRVG